VRERKINGRVLGLMKVKEKTEQEGISRGGGRRVLLARNSSAPLTEGKRREKSEKGHSGTEKGLP